MFTSGPYLADDGDTEPSAKVLPDTGGAGLWKAAFGLLMLLTGLLASSKSWEGRLVRN